MSDRQLIIFVSDTLRRGDFLDLSSGTSEVLVVGNRKLTVEEEPAATCSWENGLANIFIKGILSLEDWQNFQVRIACHLRTCFGEDPRVFRESDQRFHEKEKSLKESLNHDLDVQVWGFHHDEDWSPIWRTVVQVIKVRKAAEDGTKIDFLEALEKVFQTGNIDVKVDLDIVERQKLWEHLSVVKHQVLGSLGPFRLTVQTANELRDENPKEARERLAKINTAIDAKLPEARRMLEGCKRIVPEGTSRVMWDEASRRLAERPSLENFGLWLDGLDDSLTKLRDSIKR